MNQDILELKKALDTSSTNGNNVLDPVLLSKIISDQARRKAQIRNVIPRQPWNGLVYYWDTEISPGDASIQADGATLSLVDGVYSQSQAKMSNFYAAGYISNVAIDAAQELTDLVAMRVGGTTKSVLRKENAAIFNGDPANAQNVGLFAALKASPTYGSAGDGATLSRSLMTTMETNLFGEGYEIDAWVVSKGVYSMLKEAAFNQVRFLGLQDGGQFGFPIAGGQTLMFNGKPVIMDIYAGQIIAIASEAVGTGTGSQVAFTLANTPVNPTGSASLSDQAGTSLPAPVVKIAGVTKVLGTDYTISGKTITFVVAPANAAAVTATYSYQNENAFALSLNPADLVIAEMRGLTVDKDNIQAPVTMDAIPFRIREYCTLAVRNPNAHCVATNIVLPSSYTSF